MPLEDTVIIKIDTETKEKMKKINKNWSEVIRHAIKAEIEKQRNLAKAVMQTYEILGAQKKRGRADESTKMVRYWRDHRYGPDSR